MSEIEDARAEALCGWLAVGFAAILGIALIVTLGYEYAMGVKLSEAVSKVLFWGAAVSALAFIAIVSYLDPGTSSGRKGDGSSGDATAATCGDGGAACF